MQEVVCFNCGRIVHVSPDAELCSVCGENLRELIHPAYASTYFYDRAAAMASGTDLLQALREIDRGLGYQPSSELRLLGAILSQRIGDFEQMRHHLAAVPVDDVLRPEAEWLLRSHQNRQREQRTATRTATPTRSAASRTATAKQIPEAEENLLPPFDQEFAEEALQLPIPLPPSDKTQVAPQPTGTQWYMGSTRLWLYLALLFVVAVATGLILTNRGSSFAFLPWLSTVDATAGEQTDPAIVVPVHQADDETTQPDQTLLPTATPDVGVPSDVVQIVEPLAESTAGALVVNPLQPFDLDAYLLESNRPDLAQLGVVATSQDGTLRLDGFVPSFQDREDLVALMEAAPGVNRVSGVNILVRLPPTYTVAEGDTLWAISYRLYGEDQIAKIIGANRDILPSSNMLTIGMVLKVPTVE